MRQNGNRVIKVIKADLIIQIEENKAKHIKEYAQAVINYKLEAAEQVSNLQVKNGDGGLNLRLELTSPVDNSENYDKIAEMFKWEIDTEIELTQDEFNEYVQDDNSYSRNANVSNTFYSGKFG